MVTPSDRSYNASLVTHFGQGTCHALIRYNVETGKVEAMAGHWSHLSWSAEYDEVFRSSRRVSGGRAEIRLDGGNAYRAALGLPALRGPFANTVVPL